MSNADSTPTDRRTTRWARRVHPSNVLPSGVDRYWTAKMLAVVVMGLGLGTLVSADPVAVPVAGTVSGILVGGVGLVVGIGVYTRVPSTGCGCSSDCGC